MIFIIFFTYYVYREVPVLKVAMPCVAIEDIKREENGELSDVSVNFTGVALSNAMSATEKFK
jgi:hypothetical protein